MAKKFYITTTAPYVNADPHIGFALEIIQADAVARYHRLLGEEVIFGCGTDEHGLKIYRKALEEKLSPQKYCDQSVTAWNKLKQVLNLSYTHFIRTTERRHLEAAQALWQRCQDNGDIYKKTYKSKYCVGCELEKTDSELEQGRCPIHPNLEIELINEENYFFRFSKYQKPLLDFYAQNPDFVVPRYRFNEIIEFVKNGLEDFSVSRLKSKMPWGVDIPGDPNHVMYVWFDALVFYISTLGWPKIADFAGFWPGIQVAGKDNLRQQSAIWQAMLMSASLPNTRQILIHGFIQSGGQKMSKSLGNVIDPIFLSQKYGADALRYYLLAKIHPFNDSDFTIQLFEEAYNSDLANGLGNLTSRIITMCQKFTGGVVPPKIELKNHPLRKLEIAVWKMLEQKMPTFEFHLVLESIWNFIHALDKYIDETKPWVLAKQGKQKQIDEIIFVLLDCLKDLAWLIAAFLPEAAQKITTALNLKDLLAKDPIYKDNWASLKPGTKIKPIKSLFPRI
ncbi:MAG: methionine--tRNA ligase [Parcubacteria group bacterium CG1_02_44_65]|nr:MAG: methionine--tRNA ligase [Parcubacteria group bacterium CG1_02_44_65]